MSIPARILLIARSTRSVAGRVPALACLAAMSVAAPIHAQVCGTFEYVTQNPIDTPFSPAVVSADGSVIVSAYISPGLIQYNFRWTGPQPGVVQELYRVPSTQGRVLGLSADGVVAVGYYNTASLSSRAAIWPRSGGIFDLGVLPGGAANSQALAANADGSVVVGYSGLIQGGARAFRWTWSDGMVNLGLLPGATLSVAAGVSADGSVVVGHSGGFSPSPIRAFRWTAGGGMQDIGVLPGSAYPNSRATGVSADGSVIVGFGFASSIQEVAFRWTADGGMQPLTTAPNTTSRATAVNADGSVIVGYYKVGNGSVGGFRWTAATGMQDVGRLHPERAVYPYSVSADGSIIAGAAHDGQDDFVFRWVLCPPCPANFNGTGGLTPQDIFDFLNAWFVGATAADFNGVSGITPQDIFDFLNAWFAGC